LSLALLIVVEGLGNLNAFSSPGAPSKDSLLQLHKHLSWQAGIQSADATVGVTALLLLVASVNIAVAATSSADDRRLSQQQVADHFWSRSMGRVVEGAGATAVVISASQVTSAPGLAVILVAISSIAILMSSATIERSDEKLSRGFQWHDTGARLTAVRKARRKADKEFPAHIKPGTPAKRLAKSIGWMLALGFLVCAAVVGEYTTSYPLTGISKSDALELGLFVLLVATFTAIPCVSMVMLAVARWRAEVLARPSVEVRLLRTAFWAIPVCWTAALLSANATQYKKALDWYGGLTLAFLPPALVSAWLGTSRWQRSPAGVAVQYLSVRLQLDESTALAAREAVGGNDED
jgi:hypothetical protein